MNLLYSTNIYKIYYDLSKIRNSVHSVQFLDGMRNILYYRSGTAMQKFSTCSSAHSRSSVKLHSRNTRKNAKSFHWDNFIFELKYPSTLTNELIKKSINNFWLTHVEKLNNAQPQHIIALFRAQTEIGTYFTLGRLHRLNKSDRDYYINIITGNLDIKSNDYNTETITRILISYGIRDGVAPEPLYGKKTINPTKHFQNYKHYKLPVTMNPLEYGNNPVIVMNSVYVVPVTPLTIAKITVAEKGNENKVEIIKNGNLMLSYTDRKIDENTFERFIGLNQYIYIKDSDSDKYKLDLFTIRKASRRFKAKDEDKNRDDKIITMDIETFMDNNNKMIPYLICCSDGDSTNSYYLSDFNDPECMITTAIRDLMKAKYKSYKIYFHNFAKFDSIFILNYLSKLGIVDTTINKGRIINVTLSFTAKTNEDKYYNLYFRDSLQLLLTSLRKLGKCFGIESQKGIFPYKFVNESNLDYVGPVPSFDFFEGITHDEYLEYSNKFNSNWSLRDESIKYCKDDCISLHQILTKFNQMIYDLYKLNINKYPTLPSLAFGIFRTHYLAAEQEKVFIPMLSGQVSKNIRLGYTGGATDMYIPINDQTNNELIYAYDVNSLYPFVMANYPMPVGKHTYFEGDIRKYEPEAYGFFYCKIEAPSDLIHPIIQLHVKTKSGIRTVAPTGTFEHMLFSAEMDNAIKYGYKFEIIKGYTFKKANIFNDIISNLYNIRKQYPKDEPMNYIHKIIMNSLYGRFGMDDNFTATTIVHKDAYPRFEELNHSRIIDIKPLNDNFLIELELDDTKTMVDNGSETHNINVAIASAITGYARIYMSQFKNNPKLKLFYSDTDSIYTNLNPDEMNNLFTGIVNNKELGKLKLESISKRAIFLSPKCYALESIEGNLTYKVKGLDKNINLTYEDFTNLLSKNKSISKYQEKWYKDISNSAIEVKSQVYTIQQTDNKRELIYNSNSQLMGTKAYKMINNELTTFF